MQYARYYRIFFFFDFFSFGENQDEDIRMRIKPLNTEDLCTSGRKKSVRELLDTFSLEMRIVFLFNVRSS